MSLFASNDRSTTIVCDVERENGERVRVGICTFVLQDGDEVEVVAEDGHEVVVWGGDDGWDVRCTRGLALSLKEVVTDGPAHHTAPMLLHKHLPMTHTMEHLSKDTQEMGTPL